MGPGVPELVAQRVFDELVLGILEGRICRAIVWRLGIRIIGSVDFLSREQTKVLAPQLASERGDESSCFVGLAVHCAVDEVSVLHDDGNLAVVRAHLRLYAQRLES